MALNGLPVTFYAWWRQQMETFSALLAICAGNSPVPGEFPTQRPVTRSFDVNFDLRPNKRLSKQSWCWWFETPSRPLWRHRNGTLDILIAILQMKTGDDQTEKKSSTNVDLSSNVFCGIHLTANSQVVFTNLIRNMCSKITFSKLRPHLTGTNELMNISEGETEIQVHHHTSFQTLWTEQNGRRLADDILKCISMNENYYSLTHISLYFVSEVHSLCNGLTLSWLCTHWPCLVSDR